MTNVAIERELRVLRVEQRLQRYAAAREECRKYRATFRACARARGAARIRSADWFRIISAPYASRALRSSLSLKNTLSSYISRLVITKFNRRIRRTRQSAGLRTVSCSRMQPRETKNPRRIFSSRVTRQLPFFAVN